MPFYSDEDEGTPCPVRSYSPGSNLWSRQHRDRTTLGRLTTFPLISGDDDDETVEIELTTVLPSISSFASRRKTILNEPPRRPGQTSRTKEEQQRSQQEAYEVELDEAIFKLPSPPHPPSQPLPLQKHKTPSFEEDALDYAAALQPQPTQLHQTNRITSAKHPQQPRRPTTAAPGVAKSGRRLSAWIEAKVQEKRKQRIAAHQSQTEIELAKIHTTTQQQRQQQQYADGKRISAPESLGGAGAGAHASPEEIELAKSYLNAPPKRGAARPMERSHDAGNMAGKGKENILPDPDPRYEDVKPMHTTVPSKKVFEQISKDGVRDKKRPALVEDSINKKSKFNRESEFKAPLYPTKRPYSSSLSTSRIYEDPSNKRQSSSPQPKFVSDSDLEEDSHASIYNPLTRNPNESSQSWDHSPSRNGKLRLIKRRKVSDEASVDGIALNPAQAALAQQLASRQQKEKALKNGLIRPVPQPSVDSINLMNPVLSDNLAQVRMYEDSWLSMLEASVTQLVNGIFSQYEATRASTIETHIQLRREMIVLYSTLPSLHKRIQASLAFGALAVPKGSIIKSSAVKTWGEDLGLKKKFIDLFMNTYDIEILGIALEVVIGRELFGRTGHRASDAEIIQEGTYILSMQEKDKVKFVTGFLEKFLVNCEDAYLNPPLPRHSTARIVGSLGIGRTKGAALGRSAMVEDDWGSVAWGMRKTILRAFMLILLLDKTKRGEKNLLGTRCLFNQTSQYKSSLSILHAVARLLLPSLGDIVRPLSLMGYTVEHIQHPLEEYPYMVENLAVDMRDGARFVRLVELLLYPSEVQAATKTGIWPLSKELKFPAISRVHKIKNVTIALEALEDVGGNENDVKPEDIVDGYREKTVGLLWGVVGRWGLEMGVGGLVDWSELRKEIRRLKRDKIKTKGVDLKSVVVEDEEEDEERGYIALLKSWARCIAETKGLRVENMTTSFADGKVFEAIVEEYEGFFPKKATGSQGTKLETRLKQLGCSSYFASLFGDKKRLGKVFDRDFVIGGLAFLCSRLLQWSIRERAATSIQRVFRAWKFSQVAHMRVHFLILAYECAAFVQSKERVINAAIVIQRAFRVHLRVKLDRLINAVIGIQCTVRGYLIRRDLQTIRDSTVKIQRWWRELREKQFRQRTSVLIGNLTELQALARGYLERRRIDDVYYAVAIVGAEYGRILKGRRVREQFLQQRVAATKIQRWYKDMTEMQRDRAEFLGVRNSMIKSQALIRGKLVRDDYKAQVNAAVVIQRYFRSCVEITKARYYFTVVLWATMVVQGRRRETMVAREARKEYLLLRTYTIAIQQRFRQRKAIENATLVLQRTWRKFNWVVRMRKMLREVVLVQSVWRGYLVRKAAKARVKLVRRKIVKAMRWGKGGDESLGARVMKGIAMLKAATGLGRGLLQLDYTTTNSRECGAMLAADEEAMKVLSSHIETATKQLQKPSSTAPNRNLVLIFNILLNISRSTSARNILAKRSGGKDIFLVLFNYLVASSKQPSASGELYKNTIDILQKFCSENAEIRRRLAYAQNGKCVETLSELAKCESEKAKLPATATIAAGGKSGVAKKDTASAGINVDKEGKMRVEKIGELLKLLVLASANHNRV